MSRSSLVLASTLERLAGLGGIQQGTVRGGVGSQVYRALRRAIVDVVLVPGTAVNESDVAQQFGVSRTPVREAFRSLLADGLLDVVPQKGTFASLLHRSALRDALFVREALECAAVARATRAPLSDRKVLLRIVERQRDAIRHEDREGSLGADEELHRMIMVLAGHASAWEVVRQARTHLDRLRRIASTELRGSEEALAFHEQIAAAVIAGDEVAAVALLREHIRQIEGFIERIADIHPEYVGD